MMQKWHIVKRYVRYTGDAPQPGNLSDTTDCGKPVLATTQYIIHSFVDNGFWYDGRVQVSAEMVDCKGCMKANPAIFGESDVLFPFIFRDVRAHRCLRMLMMAGSCTQAVFMKLYTSIGKFPQRDSSHFERYWERDKPIKRSIIPPTNKRRPPASRSGYTPAGRYMLTWTGPTPADYLKSLTDSQLSEAFGFMEWSMLGDNGNRMFLSESVDESIAWILLIKAEQERR